MAHSICNPFDEKRVYTEWRDYDTDVLHREYGSLVAKGERYDFVIFDCSPLEITEMLPQWLWPVECPACRGYLLDDVYCVNIECSVIHVDESGRSLEIMP